MFLRLVFFGFRHEWSTSFIYTTAIVCVSGRPGLQWSVFFVGNGGVLNQSERCSVATIRDREKKEKLFLLSSVQTRDSSNQWHNMSRPSFGLRGTSLLRCRTFFSFFLHRKSGKLSDSRAHILHKLKCCFRCDLHSPDMSEKWKEMAGYLAGERRKRERRVR